jgi:hypothetical protein
VVTKRTATSFLCFLKEQAVQPLVCRNVTSWLAGTALSLNSHRKVEYMCRPVQLNAICKRIRVHLQRESQAAAAMATISGRCTVPDSGQTYLPSVSRQSNISHGLMLFY